MVKINRKPGRPDRWIVKRQRQAGIFNGKFLKRRRAANAPLRKLEAGLRENVVFSQKTNCCKHRSSVSGTYRGAGAVRHHANRAGSGFCRGGVNMSRLGRCRPQQQRGAKPCRPSRPQTHRLPDPAFLFRVRLSTAYKGYPIQGNAAQVTIGGADDSPR